MTKSSLGKVILKYKKPSHVKYEISPANFSLCASLADFKPGTQAGVTVCGDPGKTENYHYEIAWEVHFQPYWQC